MSFPQPAVSLPSAHVPAGSSGCSGACGRHGATCWLGNNNAPLSFFIAFPQPHNHSLFCFLLFFKSRHPPMYLKLLVEMSHRVGLVPCSADPTCPFVSYIYYTSLLLFFHQILLFSWIFICSSFPLLLYILLY